jgi:uncharacterized protein involved in response to NO
MLKDVLSLGYRPFFMLGALNAVAAMLPWLYMLGGGAVPTQGWPPHTLHAHEMLYGTVVPAIAGFLLTAVPNWTGTNPITGRSLAGLVALWMAGRVALVVAGPVDPVLVAVVDIAFLPALAGVVGLPILRARTLRNLPVVIVLLGLAVANAAMHYGLRAPSAPALRAGTMGSVYLVVLLMLIISGRITPLFTRNALARRGVEVAIPSRRTLGAVAIGAAVLALAVDLVRPQADLSAGLALAAGPLLIARQAGWQPARVMDQPMLWVLHLGHAWIAIGFLLHGLSLLTESIVGAGALHAFTAGAMGTLILGVMSRVSLGHGGQAIEASRATGLMFALVSVGALLRVSGALLAGPLYVPAILVGGMLWTSAWLLFCVTYGSVLVGLRKERV